MILDDLRQWIDRTLAPWLATQSLAMPVYMLEEPPAEIPADVACNLALLLAKPLKKSPRAIAQELQTILNAAPDRPIGEITIAGAGFLNLTWKPETLSASLKQLLQEKDTYGRMSPAPKEKILIEFVSANPTGPLHVGHGRGAALGDSLALIFAHLGYSVSREYYINDAGNQVELLGQSLLARALEVEGQPFTMPEEGYHGDYIKDVAQEFVQKVPAAERTPARAIAFALERLLLGIRTDLEEFGVHFDSWYSEAQLVAKGAVDAHVAQLQQRGHVEETEGALWFVAPGEESEEKDKNRVLKRRDGRWTYFATDIAYHADKLERGFDRLIDLWGADHHGYVARVKGSLAALGFNPAQLQVILYQLVSLTRNGTPVSMSKRSGDFIMLKDVLKEVGRDACRFFFALRGPNTAFDFDLELAKKQTVDNPVYYLQYAHARICSIFRQAAEKSVGGAGDALHLLTAKEERDLIKRLIMFPQCLRVCAQENSPHPLATYLLQVARQFHHFYDHHRVLGEDPQITGARLALLDAVRTMLRLGLKLLGVSAPESM
jgi:arginyl-tRNA synthetase